MYLHFKLIQIICIALVLSSCKKETPNITMIEVEVDSLKILREKVEKAIIDE
jgi:nicotinate-nucleotide pyrophosphorylase